MSALPSAAFWRNQRVFLTGHTGFKGGWTALWLKRMGATVCGYALPPSTEPSLFAAAGIGEQIESHFGDIRDLDSMREVFDAFAPTIVLHMAAQPLVRLSYAQPLETYSTNVMGTAHVLELARAAPGVKATIVVTTDKCYENVEQIWSYRENDRLGGRDPYSNSKACAELVTSSYWWSYFSQLEGQGLASGRAGNVVGGGDWSKDRLVPDLVAAFAEDRPAILRRPEGVRPWQHVLEPVCGYLLAAELIATAPKATAPPAWNFGPNPEGNVEVGKVAELLVEAWGGSARYEVHRDPNAVHEATLLTLDQTKAQRELDWRPRWSLQQTLQKTAEWYRAYYTSQDVLAVTHQQLDDYTGVQAPGSAS
ncbi:CDP-glucose 4,6-dehydratase [Caulobacter sp. HMWF025]|uniref:CDP-glucose 4,6-dehydratase n=1 Tax=Caulobacter sp. HMWF025 TaxID=2056860 RepID=UPI000D3B76E6|nr:CDP-glucose 4,6-dehydratase [Caulobacter sp. HMWF025]PTT12512.1 CDP-glucose 4,6-dehydratase [Caulobacter sp. HMWF025]PTT77553.1 CDP-glucose 4,6-dehydratase [Pseudomonas sp. HMWF010]